MRLAIASALVIAITGAGVYASVSAGTKSVSVPQAHPKENPTQNQPSASQFTQIQAPDSVSATTPPAASIQTEEVKVPPTPTEPKASTTQKQVVSRGQPSTNRKGAIAYDWWTQASKYWPRGTTATVIDVRTGISFKVLRTMGTNHADVEPVSAGDSEAIKRAWGGNFSWDRRPVVVIFGNYRMAAGMTSMPEGSEQIANNGAAGHMNIHFVNSRTHGTNRVDPNYQAAIKQAEGH